MYQCNCNCKKQKLPLCATIPSPMFDFPLPPPPCPPQFQEVSARQIQEVSEQQLRCPVSYCLDEIGVIVFTRHNHGVVRVTQGSHQGQTIIFNKSVVTFPPQLPNLKLMLRRDDIVRVASFPSNEWPGYRASDVSLISRSGRTDCGVPSADYWRSYWEKYTRSHPKLLSNSKLNKNDVGGISTVIEESVGMENKLGYVVDPAPATALQDLLHQFDQNHHRSSNHRNRKENEQRDSYRTFRNERPKTFRRSRWDDNFRFEKKAKKFEKLKEPEARGMIFNVQRGEEIEEGEVREPEETEIIFNVQQEEEEVREADESGPESAYENYPDWALAIDEAMEGLVDIEMEDF